MNLEDLVCESPLAPSISESPLTPNISESPLAPSVDESSSPEIAVVFAPPPMRTRPMTTEMFVETFPPPFIILQSGMNEVCVTRTVRAPKVFLRGIAMARYSDLIDLMQLMMLPLPVSWRKFIAVMPSQMAPNAEVLNYSELLVRFRRGDTIQPLEASAYGQSSFAFRRKFCTASERRVTNITDILKNRF